MEKLIIGEGSLEIHEIATTVEKSESCSILQSNWRIFAEHLMVSDVEMPDLERRINTGVLKLKEVPRELLKIWKASKGSSATLTALHDALVECRLRNIADALKDKYCPTGQKSWSQFMVQGIEVSLDNLSEQTFKSITENLGRIASDEPEELIREQLPEGVNSEYYISRTLVCRYELDEEIFKASNAEDHIFVMKGARKYELAQAIDFQFIKESGSQLNEVTEKFILLEFEDDFDCICRKSIKPVHLIEYENNRFYWRKSSKGVNVIRPFLKETSEEEFNEEEAIERITSPNYFQPFNITDSPGMGKSTVLVSLARKIKQNQPNALVFFFVLNEFIQHVENYYVDPIFSAIEAISSYVTLSDWGKLIVQEILNEGSTFLYLFLDGYDEVQEHKLNLTDGLLRKLKDVSNIRIIVSTRPHLNSRLENVFNQLSFQIQPFDESNQVDFLTRYWVNEHSAKDTKILEDYARQCLRKLETKMTDKERSIAGIPLQCMLLAKVYAKDAKRASQLSSLPENDVKDISLFEMYKLLVDQKFDKIFDSGNPMDKASREIYMDAHIYKSINLLFPQWSEAFKPCLCQSEEVDENRVFSIGLIEKNLFSSTPKFIHRTFAEYFVAEFIVSKLNTNVLVWSILFKDVFAMSTNNTTKVRDSFVPYRYKSKYPVLAYIVNVLLKNRFNQSEMTAFSFFKNLHLGDITIKDLCAAANVCCYDDLENCFDLTAHLMHHFDIKNEIYLRKNGLNYLPHIVVERTTNISLLEKVLNLLKIKFEVDIGNHFFKIRDTDPFSPIHVAVCLAKYNFVMYFLQNYKENVQSMKYLLHVCVRDTAKASDAEVENRLSIIGALVKLNSEWVNEEGLPQQTPVLQDGVHWRLIVCLVNLGADINSHSQEYGTILHTGADRYTYLNLLRWALHNGFKQVNCVDKWQRTPLIALVLRFGDLPYEDVKLLCDSGADINAEDVDGNTVLLHALNIFRRIELAHTTKKVEVVSNRDHFDAPKTEKFEDKVEFVVDGSMINDKIIQIIAEVNHSDPSNPFTYSAVVRPLHPNFVENLLEFGANPNQVNRSKENAAHLILKNYHYQNNPDLALLTLALLELKGFQGFIQKDHHGNTPLRLALKLGIRDQLLLMYLVSRDSQYRRSDVGAWAVASLLISTLCFLWFM